jgi:hypothetical protein
MITLLIEASLMLCDFSCHDQRPIKSIAEHGAFNRGGVANKISIDSPTNCVFNTPVLLRFI